MKMKKIQFEAKKLEIFIFFTYMIREGFKKKKNLVCLLMLKMALDVAGCVPMFKMTLDVYQCSA